MAQESYSIKTIIIGKEYVGKTSLTLKLLKVSTNVIEPTIGASFQIFKNNNIRYDIWDTAGQERYLSIVRMFYTGAQIVLLVYDLSNLQTIERVKYHLDKLSQMFDPNQLKILIIGNKLDMVTDTTQATELIDDIINKSIYKENMQHILTSVLSDENIITLIEKIDEYGQEILFKIKSRSEEFIEEQICLSENTDKSFYQKLLNRCMW